MKINIKTTATTDLSPALREYVENKMSAVEKFLDSKDESIIVDFEIGKITAHHRQGEVFQASVNLQMTGTLLRAEATEEDQYAAIDKAKDEIVREIKKTRGKKDALFKRGARKIKKIMRFGQE